MFIFMHIYNNWCGSSHAPSSHWIVSCHKEIIMDNVFPVFSFDLFHYLEYKWSSIEFLFGNFDNFDVSVAESDEKSVSEGVPGDWGHLMEFISFDFLGLFLINSLLSI